MPKLIRLYVVNVAIGFGLAVAFVAMMVWMDVANLRHLILGSDIGWVAALMLVMFNGVVFGGAQFAIAVMRLAEPPEGPRGGRKHPVGLIPIKVEVTANATRKGVLPRR